MLQELLSLATIVKYIIIGLGIFGAIILAAGMYRKERKLITTGGYMFIMAIILWVCGYFILSTTASRGEQQMYDYYIQGH